MRSRWIGASGLLAIAIVTTSLLGATTVRAADERFVTVAAECVRTIGSDTGLPTVRVTIENQSQLPLHIAYLQSFGSPPIGDKGPTGLKLDKPKRTKVIDVADGETVTLEATWAGGELRRSHTIVALAVTSAGVFLPVCNADAPENMTYDGPVPDGGRAAMEESAAIAAESIGQLEAWRAYPALYALLHPEAQDKVSYEGMTCWYAVRFGPPHTDETQTIFTTDVRKVVPDDWTWAVTGTTFTDSAEVTYDQAIGRSADAEPEESVMHMVQEDGVWRWFFGGSAEGVAGLATDCELPATT